MSESNKTPESRKTSRSINLNLSGERDLHGEQELARREENKKFASIFETVFRKLFLKNINIGSVGSASDIKEKWDRKEYSDIETGYVNALISGIMPRLRADSYSRNDTSGTSCVGDDCVGNTCIDDECIVGKINLEQYKSRFKKRDNIANHIDPNIYRTSFLDNNRVVPFIFSLFGITLCKKEVYIDVNVLLYYVYLVIDSEFRNLNVEIPYNDVKKFVLLYGRENVFDNIKYVNSDGFHRETSIYGKNVNLDEINTKRNKRKKKLPDIPLINPEDFVKNTYDDEGKEIEIEINADTDADAGIGVCIGAGADEDEYTNNETDDEDYNETDNETENDINTDAILDTDEVVTTVGGEKITIGQTAKAKGFIKRIKIPQVESVKDIFRFVMTLVVSESKRRDLFKSRDNIIIAMSKMEMITGLFKSDSTLCFYKDYKNGAILGVGRRRKEDKSADKNHGLRLGDGNDDIDDIDYLVDKNNSAIDELNNKQTLSVLVNKDGLLALCKIINMAYRDKMSSRYDGYDKLFMSRAVEVFNSFTECMCNNGGLYDFCEKILVLDGTASNPFIMCHIASYMSELSRSFSFTQKIKNVSSKQTMMRYLMSLYPGQKDIPMEGLPSYAYNRDIHETNSSFFSYERSETLERLSRVLCSATNINALLEIIRGSLTRRTGHKSSLFVNEAMRRIGINGMIDYVKMCDKQIHPVTPVFDFKGRVVDNNILSGFYTSNVNTDNFPILAILCDNDTYHDVELVYSEYDFLISNGLKNDTENTCDRNGFFGLSVSRHMYKLINDQRKTSGGFIRINRRSVVDAGTASGVDNEVDSLVCRKGKGNLASVVNTCSDNVLDHDFMEKIINKEIKPVSYNEYALLKSSGEEAKIRIRKDGDGDGDDDGEANTEIESEWSPGLYDDLQDIADTENSDSDSDCYGDNDDNDLSEEDILIDEQIKRAMEAVNSNTRTGIQEDCSVKNNAESVVEKDTEDKNTNQKENHFIDLMDSEKKNPNSPFFSYELDEKDVFDVLDDETTHNEDSGIDKKETDAVLDEEKKRRNEELRQRFFSKKNSGGNAGGKKQNNNINCDVDPFAPIATDPYTAIDKTIACEIINYHDSFNKISNEIEESGNRISKAFSGDNSQAYSKLDIGAVVEGIMLEREARLKAKINKLYNGLHTPTNSDSGFAIKREEILDLPGITKNGIPVITYHGIEPGDDPDEKITGNFKTSNDRHNDDFIEDQERLLDEQGFGRDWYGNYTSALKASENVVHSRFTTKSAVSELENLVNSKKHILLDVDHDSLLSGDPENHPPAIFERLDPEDKHRLFNFIKEQARLVALEYTKDFSDTSLLVSGALSAISESVFAIQNQMGELSRNLNSKMAVSYDVINNRITKLQKMFHDVHLLNETNAHILVGSEMQRTMYRTILDGVVPVELTKDTSKSVNTGLIKTNQDKLIKDSNLVLTRAVASKNVMDAHVSRIYGGAYYRISPEICEDISSFTYRVNVKMNVMILALMTLGYIEIDRFSYVHTAADITVTINRLQTMIEQEYNYKAELLVVRVTPSGMRRVCVSGGVTPDHESRGCTVGDLMIDSSLDVIIKEFALSYRFNTDTNEKRSTGRQEGEFI